MPAEIVPGEFCASWWGEYKVPSSSDPTKIYFVSLTGGEGMAYCTCPAFQHFKGHAYDRTCKHIDFVHRHACMWNCQWHEGNKPITLWPQDYTRIDTMPHPEHQCPNCAGSVMAVRIAV